MLVELKDNILFVVYDNIDEIVELQSFADKYEGKINGRYGLNFPFNIIKSTKVQSKLISKILKYEAQYLIAYKKGDIITKKHEMQHAKYYIDSEYRDSVKKMWDSFDNKYKSNVISMLGKMGYPDHVMLDEFQAYYYTEKTNFFGRI
jgi:hypothetical protein